MSGDENRAVRAVARLSRILECSLDDLTLAQYRVLVAVDDGGERATALAHWLALAKPTVTSAVDGLVDRGYLVREPVPGDRRALRIVLTPTGRQALAGAETAMAARLAAVLAHTSGPGGARTALEALSGLGPALDGSLAEALAAARPAGR